MLRKILVKVFVTNKFTQCKTSRTLKVDVFEITDNKNIGKLSSKYELLLLDQANSSSDPSQALTLRFLIFSYPIQPNATTSIGYTKAYGKPSQSNSLSSCLQVIIVMGQARYPSES